MVTKRREKRNGIFQKICRFVSFRSRDVRYVTRFVTLREKRNDLRNEVDRTKSHMQDEAANFPDPVDRAAQEEEFSLELRTRDRERKLIKKIEKTIQLIKEDDFGYCESCGIEIGIRRLEARPTADLCVDCKTLAEIKEKQSGRG